MPIDLRPLALVVLVACAGISTDKAEDSGSPDDTDFPAPPGETTTLYPVDSATTPEHSGCASTWWTHSGTVYCGRPLDVGGPRRAEAAAAPAWAGAVEVDAPPDAAALAEAWRRQGLEEHASVGSFARFTLDLLAVAAPPELLAEAQRAAGDEVEHARLCFALARALDGRDEGPGPLVTPAIPPCAGLADLAVRTLLEGCLNETVAAAVAVAQRATATDPEVFAALDRIAEDEARHAALAWRTVEWALRTGGPEVRAAVAAAYRTWSPVVPATGRDRSGDGWPSDAALAAVVARTQREVIAPAAAALGLA